MEREDMMMSRVRVHKKAYQNRGRGILLLTAVLALVFLLPMGRVREAEAAAVKLNSTKKTLYVSETYTLKLSGTKARVNWSSSKKSVAAVSSAGKVTAVKAGSATITAKVNGKKYSCKVTVKKPTMKPSSVTMDRTGTKQLKLNKTYKNVKWSSSNKAVAAVNNKGLVTAAGFGTCTITAKVGSVSLKCKVTIPEPVMEHGGGYLKTGTSRQFTLSGGEGEVTWSSSDDQIASVDTQGFVTGKKAGTATIYADIEGYTCSAQITVTDRELFADKTELNFPELEDQIVKVTFLQKKELKLEVGSLSVATARWGEQDLDTGAGTLIITPLSQGQTVIKITSPYTSEVLSISVSVTAAPKPQILSPQYRVYLLPDTRMDALSVVFTVVNDGSKPMRIYSGGAALIDEDYPFYDRTLYLIDTDIFERTKQIVPIEYVDIQPGSSYICIYLVQGNSTWYDKYTYIFFRFLYDGVDYLNHSSYYYGSIYDYYTR
ncbi:Ig-like domain-containing protein [Anaerolentibacter hominis]|uniref:Ig-like domain-containing protein n=1 Tax=Anaerolentibacter hominis TaxID=3079009 RepID=UPI0031B7FDE7